MCDVCMKDEEFRHSQRYKKIDFHSTCTLLRESSTVGEVLAVWRFFLERAPRKYHSHCVSGLVCQMHMSCEMYECERVGWAVRRRFW